MRLLNLRHPNRTRRSILHPPQLLLEPQLPSQLEAFCAAAPPSLSAPLRFASASQLPLVAGPLELLIRSSAFAFPSILRSNQAGLPLSCFLKDIAFSFAFLPSTLWNGNPIEGRSYFSIVEKLMIVSNGSSSRT